MQEAYSKPSNSAYNDPVLRHKVTLSYMQQNYFDAS